MTEFSIRLTDNTRIIGDFVTNAPGEINLIGKGDTATYAFVETASKLTIGSGDTFTVESGTTVEFSIVEVNGTLVVEAGGTLNTERIDNNGTVNNNGTININERYVLEYSEIEAYADYAGNFTISETLNAEQKYTEQFSSTEIDDLLVGIEPQTELANQEIGGFWGLITNVTDSRNTSLSNGPRMEIEIQVLAPFDEYADHTAVQNALEL